MIEHLIHIYSKKLPLERYLYEGQNDLYALVEYDCIQLKEEFIKDHQLYLDNPTGLLWPVAHISCGQINLTNEAN